jgi:Right handed beta helix region
VNRLSPGQTGCLLDGTFTENVRLSYGGASGSPLTVTAAPAATPALCGYLEVRESANYVTIANLRIDGSCTSSIHGENTLQIWGDFVTLRGNDITNRRRARSCLFLGHHSFGLAYNTLVDRNRIHDCGSDTFYDHGIYAAATRDLRVTNNYIYDSGGWAIHLWRDAQRSVIEHNVLDGAPESGLLLGGDESYQTSDTYVAYNIFTWNSTWGVDQFWAGPPGSGNLVELNCFWANDRGPFDEQIGFTERNNTLADPLYVDRSARDFRLRPGSPCAAMGPP